MRNRTRLRTYVELKTQGAWGAAMTIFGPVLSGFFYLQMLGAAASRESGTLWAWLLVVASLATLTGPIMLLLGVEFVTSGETEDVPDKR